jgi:acetyltransferase-like isoleucine patch superfamily enzyme
MNSFLSTEEIRNLGLKSFGVNVLISRFASIYNPSLLSVGNNVRIDDFCIISGEITLGSNIHIGAFCALYGKFGIKMDDFTGLSPRCTIFSAKDDFSGDFLISPMSDEAYTNVTGGLVHIESYSQIGSGTVIMPDITIGEGVAVGAMSYVNQKLDAWKIYAGVPVKLLKDRKKGLLKFI